MGQNRKQHFIPQCYLRLFSEDGKHICTYDKIRSTSYRASISDVCTINDFYTISNSYVSEENLPSELIIEKDFFADTYEPTYANWLNKIDKACSEAVSSPSKKIDLNNSDKLEFAYLISIQWFRLPLIREQGERTFNELMPKVLRLFSQGLAKETNNPEMANLNVTAEISDKAAYHAKSTFMNEELVNAYAKALSENIWTFRYCADGQFYTSDFPINVKPHVKNVCPFCEGLAQYGAELTFPVSKNCMIIIWDKSYFSHMKQDDCTVEYASIKDIGHFNIQRYAFTKRHLFSCNGNFGFIDQMHKQRPIEFSL